MNFIDDYLGRLYFEHPDHPFAEAVSARGSIPATWGTNELVMAASCAKKFIHHTADPSVSEL
jgi:hypothetical protein